MRVPGLIVGELQKFGIEVIIPGLPDLDSLEGKMMLQLQHYVAAKENAFRHHRLSAGRIIAAKSGQMPTGFGYSGGPYGLRWDPQKRLFVWRSENHKRTCEFIFGQAIRGKTISAITRALNEPGAGWAPPAIANEWNRSSVGGTRRKAILYSGLYHWKERYQ